MDILNTSLFASTTQRAIVAGFHNIGSGVLRASNEAIVKKIEAHYGERCGHFPLNSDNVRILVGTHTEAVQSQMAYLSQLFGKAITTITFDELKNAQTTSTAEQALVVPYINVPETETRIQDELGATSWGLPGNMVTILKNKADFYKLAEEFNIGGFHTPDYTVAHLNDLARTALRFLGEVEAIVTKAGLSNYPLGVMLRASESDGNYGCCLLHEQDGRIIGVPDGEAHYATYYTNWREALELAQKHLAATMNPQKETRVVISRYLDMADSPGMSVVIMNGKVETLGWNGQLQKKGSKACVGTSTYRPRNAYLARLQQEYEHQTAAFFETLLRKTAHRCGVDFASLRGVANIDIIIPGRWEKQLQKKRGQLPVHYIAECNPRWTNYTDAIMTVIAANRKEQTINNMRTVIQEGISTIDKHPLPEDVDPRAMREMIYARDTVLKRDGTRIICRMAHNPMGLIFAGDIPRAEQEVASIARESQMGSLT